MLFALLISPALSANAVAEPWRFVVTGDSYGTSQSYDEKGVNTLILGELVDEILSHDVECVLFPGDLVMGEKGNKTYDMETQLTTWINTMGPLYDAGVKVYPVRGNHDTETESGLGPWNNIFSDEYALPDNGPENEKNLTFSAMHNNALIVGLDLYVDHHKVNQDWLDAQSLTTSHRIFLFSLMSPPLQ